MERISSASRSRGRLRIALPDLVWIDRCGGRKRWTSSPKLFGEFLVFVYHCFDRIVIHGYLTALSRPELVVHFFRDIVGVAEVSKEVLSQRTNDYQRWVEAYARNHSIPIEWAEKGVRKEDHVLPWLHRMARRDAYGVYFIFKSMEQGPTYRVSLPKYPSKDPHYRILAHQRSRFTPAQSVTPRRGGRGDDCSRHGSETKWPTRSFVGKAAVATR